MIPGGELTAQPATVKTFVELESEVVKPGLCAQCGGCVSFCSAGQLHALVLDERGLPRFSDRRRCLACGLCYLVCPVTHELDGELQQRFGSSAGSASTSAVASARATDPAVRRVATDGGVVTSLLLYLLDKRLVDGAIVSTRTESGGRTPTVATTRAEIIAAAGSHFSGTAHLEQLGARYTTYTPSISAVKSLEGDRLHRVALVGTPCQVIAMRKMQCLGIVPADAITYAIGLFCLESFSFTPEDFQARLGISEADVAGINVKDEFLVTLRDGRELSFPLAQLDEWARPACLACVEFANEYADLAAGGLGSNRGYTTVVVRTERGRRLYTEAIRAGYVEEETYRDTSEMQSRKATMLGQIAAFSRLKRERGTARRGMIRDA